MASYAIIESGTITNIVEASTNFAVQQGWIENQGWGIGWVSDGQGGFEPPPVQLPEIIYPKFSSLDMLDLFTGPEQLAVVEATLVSAPVKLWYDRLLAAEFVTYEDPRTEGGLLALVGAGLLSKDRKDAIVAAMQPALS